MNHLELKTAVLWTAFLVLGSTALTAQSISTLYTFPPTSNNFEQEPTGLVADSDGNLYGILQSGGNMACKPAGCGQIYKLTSPGGSFGTWTEETLYQFTGESDGCWPIGQLAIDSSGALYGVTSGASCSPNAGTVFKLTPSSKTPWKLDTIYDQGLNAVLALDSDGNIYGTSYSAAVELVKPKTSSGKWDAEQIATIVGGATGGLQFFDGDLYGTTSVGGSGFGTAFELSPPAKGRTNWTLNSIATFKGGTDGSGPTGNNQLGLSVVSADEIFGVTQGSPPCAAPGDCGTVYELQKQKNGTWLRTAIYQFDGTNGALPTTVTATSNGNHVFGSAFEGTGAASSGTAFQLSAPAKSGESWTEQAFDFADWTVSSGGGYSFGNVLIDEDGLGVYMTPQGADAVVDVQSLIPVGPPYEETGSAACIELGFPTGEVTVKNTCSRRVDFWFCGGASSKSTKYCTVDGKIIDFSKYQAAFLGSKRSATIKVFTEPGFETNGVALVCNSGVYPIYYTDTLGNPHLYCGTPAK
jgi:uncharacterized repeat protein (TIGR03803 family)